MGQKVIPKGLRLDIFKNWDSQWIADPSKYANFFYFDYNIRNYLTTLSNHHQLNLNNIKIKKQANSLQIYLLLHNSQVKKPFLNLQQLKQKKQQIEQNIQNFSNQLLLNYNINIYIININISILKKGSIFYQIVKFYRKKPFSNKLKKFLGIFNIAIYTQSVLLFNQFLIKDLLKTPKHLQYLKNVNDILFHIFTKYPNFIGYKIQWKGRLNGRERSKKICYQSGPIPLNTLKYDIKYDCQEIITPSGACSLKTWFLFK